LPPLEPQANANIARQPRMIGETGIRPRVFVMSALK